MDWRRGLTYAVAVAAFAATIWLATWAQSGGERAEHGVVVAHPERLIWIGTGNGSTPLEVLLEAADKGGFHVGVRGAGASAYVYAIDGFEEGPGGWCFIVGHDGAWTIPSAGAGAYQMEPEEELRWKWTDTRCEDLLDPAA